MFLNPRSVILFD